MNDLLSMNTVLAYNMKLLNSVFVGDRKSKVVTIYSTMSGYYISHIHCTTA